jgi:Protein of unknown function (DUF2946)
MFSQKLFRCLHKIALFAIVFASLAPSISHALAAKNSTSFAQEICTSNGKTLSIQVITSQGQQLTTEFSVNKELPAKNISMHLEHCPFCSSGSTTTALPGHPLEIIALLEIGAKKAAKYVAPAVASRHYKSPPSQAPPYLSII